MTTMTNHNLHSELHQYNYSWHFITGRQEIFIFLIAWPNKLKCKSAHPKPAWKSHKSSSKITMCPNKEVNSLHSSSLYSAHVL